MIMSALISFTTKRHFLTSYLIHFYKRKSYSKNMFLMSFHIKRDIHIIISSLISFTAKMHFLT